MNDNKLALNVYKISILRERWMCGSVGFCCWSKNLTGVSYFFLLKPVKGVLIKGDLVMLHKSGFWIILGSVNPRYSELPGAYPPGSPPAGSLLFLTIISGNFLLCLWHNRLLH